MHDSTSSGEMNISPLLASFDDQSPFGDQKSIRLSLHNDDNDDDDDDDDDEEEYV